MDRVLSEVAKLSNMNGINKSLNSLEERINDIDKKYCEKLETIDLSLSQIASVNNQTQLKSQITALEDQVQTMKTEAVMQECFNKRLNLLIHGVAKKAWETKDQTKIA